MCQTGEDVALSSETVFGGLTNERGVQQLHRGAALKSAVAALGQPHTAHAAVPNRLEQAVGAELRAGERGPRGQNLGRVLQKTRRAHHVELGEPVRDFLGAAGVLGAKRRQPHRALVVRELQRSLEVRADGFPAFALALRHVSLPTVNRAESRRAPCDGERGAPSATVAARSVQTLLSSPRSRRTKTRRRT